MTINPVTWLRTPRSYTPHDEREWRYYYRRNNPKNPIYQMKRDIEQQIITWIMIRARFEARLVTAESKLVRQVGLWIMFGALRKRLQSIRDRSFNRNMADISRGVDRPFPFIRKAASDLFLL